MVILFGILHHISDDDVLKLIDVLKLSLKKNSKIITLDPVYIKKQNKISKFLIDNDRGNFVRTSKGYLDLLEKKGLLFLTKYIIKKLYPTLILLQSLKTNQ